MRWYGYSLLGVVGGLAGLYLLDKTLIESFQRSLSGLFPTEESLPDNYVQIRIPLKISDMAIESAQKIAQSLEPRAVTPVFVPPALDFHFAPVAIDTDFVKFRWQPPPYRKLLTGKAAKPSRIALVAQKASTTFYRTEVRQLREGWELTLIGEIPL